MKKFTLSLLFAASMATVCAQNLVTNPKFEDDMTGYLATDNGVNPDGENMLIRVDSYDKELSAVANPTIAEAVAVTSGVWYRHSANTGYIKSFIRTGAFGTTGNSVFFGCSQNCGTGGLAEDFKIGIFQNLVAPIDPTYTYKISFTAKIDDTYAPHENTCNELAVRLFDIDTKTESVIHVTLNSTNFEAYTGEFTLPAGFTGARVALGFSVKGTYGFGGNDAKIFFTGALVDDVVLEAGTQVSGMESAQVATAKVFGENGNIRIAAEAGSCVNIYNVSGQLVESVIASGSQMNVAANAGAYIVTINGAAQKVLVK